MHKIAPVMLLIIFAAMRKKTIKTIIKTETNWTANEPKLSPFLLDFLGGRLPRFL